MKALFAGCVALAGLLATSDATAAARVIVEFKADAPAMRRQALAARAETLQTRVGVALRSGRAVGDRGQVLQAEGIDSATLAARLAAQPDVAWAAVDERRYALTAPNDPLYPLVFRPNGPDAGQWYLRPPDATIVSAVNAEQAWDRVTGSASVVVAVLDTGVLADHLDLSGRVLPGYDFVSHVATANDGNGRDADASDPGDWITDAEVNDSASGFYGGKPNNCASFDPINRRYVEQDSSWHGTKVSGLIGANANDGIGMAGTAYGVRILPVRVLGKCGGFDSDIIAGMYWAAGIRQDGVPVNPTPARVLNLSLGSPGDCTAAYTNAVARINAAGAVVVAAAGNSAGHAVGTPADCSGVIAVAGLRHAGTKVGFSDLGRQVAISAPAGNCVSRIGLCQYPLLTTSNSGTRRPNAGGSIWTNSSNSTTGTSFAAPIISGIAALMLSARPELMPGEVRTTLQRSARPFPTTGAGVDIPMCREPDGTDQDQCYCTTALCGAGMADASAAVALAAATALPRIAQQNEAVAGADVQFDASGSLPGAGRSIIGYQWTLLSGGGIVDGLSSASNAPSVTLQPRGSGSFTLELAVTDDTGAVARAERTIRVPRASSSSGGGAVGVPWAAALALAVLALSRTGRKTRR